MENAQHVRRLAEENSYGAPGRVQQSQHLCHNGEPLKRLLELAISNDEREIAKVLLKQSRATGVIWLGAGDPLLSSLIRGGVSRALLDEQAFALIDFLQYSFRFTGAPNFPEVDIDESVSFEQAATTPTWTKIIPAIFNHDCLGGVLIYSNIPAKPVHPVRDVSLSEKRFDEVAEAFAISFHLRQQQRQLDEASNRLREISEVGRIFADVGEPERTISRILEIAIQSSMAETGAVIHINQEGLLSATGMKLETAGAIRFRTGERLIEKALVSDEPIVWRQDEVAALVDLGASTIVLETLAAYPLLHGSRCYGAMMLVNVPDPLLGDYSFMVMLDTIARLAAAAMTTEERQAELLDQARTRQELASAHAIQKSLLPKEIPLRSGLKMAGLWKPSRSIGGDYYDIFDLGDSRIGIIIADVSGKGIPAGLLMAISRSYLRVMAPEYRDSPAAALERLNVLLCGEIADNKFITANYIVVDVAARRGCLASAGHHAPAMLCDGSVKLIEESAGVSGAMGGMPLGILPETEYTDTNFDFNQESTLLLYTDGLIEARNASSGILGQKRFLELLKEVDNLEPNALLEYLWQKTMEFSTGEMADDWTAVAIQLEGEIPH